jgi:hypothetical protein
MIAKAAVSDGIPPICYESATAIGVVAAFGARESATLREPRSKQTMPAPLTIDVKDPASRARPILQRFSRLWAADHQSVMAGRAQVDCEGREKTDSGIQFLRS